MLSKKKHSVKYHVSILWEGIESCFHFVIISEHCGGAMSLRKATIQVAYSIQIGMCEIAMQPPKALTAIRLT